MNWGFNILCEILTNWIVLAYKYPLEEINVIVFPRQYFLLYNRGVANCHDNTTFPATGALNGH